MAPCTLAWTHDGLVHSVRQVTGQRMSLQQLLIATQPFCALLGGKTETFGGSRTYMRSHVLAIALSFHHLLA